MEHVRILIEIDVEKQTFFRIFLHSTTFQKKFTCLHTFCVLAEDFKSCNTLNRKALYKRHRKDSQSMEGTKFPVTVNTWQMLEKDGENSRNDKIH